MNSKYLVRRPDLAPYSPDNDIGTRILRLCRPADQVAAGKVKENKSMSEKIRYLGEPLGDLKVVPDFLPRPEDLVFRDEGVKVTISLSRRSVEFFKNEARKHNTRYQRIIRRLRDAYAEHHVSRPRTTRSTQTRDKSSRVG